MPTTTWPAIFNLRSPISCACPRIQQIRAQERHRPAVIVLLVERPLRAQIVNQDEPIAGEGEEIEEGR